MSFAEFASAIAATAPFKYPDPFLPLNYKIESFIQDVLLPNWKSGVASADF